jgi:hypothetical protein
VQTSVLPNILAAIKREERKLKKQVSTLQHQLNGIRSDAKASGNTAVVEVKGAKKRGLSGTGRAAMASTGNRKNVKLKNSCSHIHITLDNPEPFVPASIWELPSQICMTVAINLIIIKTSK